MHSIECILFCFGHQKQKELIVGCKQILRIAQDDNNDKMYFGRNALRSYQLIRTICTTQQLHFIHMGASP